MADKRIEQLPAADRLDGSELAHVVQNGNSRRLDLDTLRQRVSPLGALAEIGFVEEEVTVSGASVSTSVSIPAGSLPLAATTRVSQAVTGAASFDVGVTGQVFTSAHPVALNSNRIGSVAPAPIPADRAILLTANGSNFTGGKVIVTAFFLKFGVPDAI